MTNEQIIAGCKAGDAKSQAALVKNYAGKLMPVCRRYAPDSQLAYDALQDTFVNVFKYIQGYKGSGNFEGWMRRIAVNCSLAYQKKKMYYTEIESFGHYRKQQSISIEARSRAINYYFE